VKSRLLLDIVVRQGPSIFELLSSKDESLLIRWDTFFVLDLCLDIVDSIWRLHIQCDGLAGQSLNEDLHTSSESQYKVESGLFLDVVVWKGSTIFKLLSCKDESLLVGWDSLLVLDFSFDVINGVWWLNVESDCFASQCLDEDLHASSESED